MNGLGFSTSRAARVRPLLVALALAGALGCSSKSPGDPAPACAAANTPAPAAIDLTQPAVGFADVMPIFRASCSAFACHGSPAGDDNGVFLGTPADTGDAAHVADGLLNVPARELPSMPYVAPGAPDRSFLMHKLDGDLCSLHATCTGGSCGDSMPSGEPLLSSDSRDRVRRWIAQGAPR
jgi:hypothetical protein